MSYPRVYFDPMYLTPRQSRKRNLAPQRRMYPVQKPTAHDEVVENDEPIESIPDRSRYKRQIQVIKHHVPVEPEPYSDFLPFFEEEKVAAKKPVPEVKQESTAARTEVAMPATPPVTKTAEPTKVKAGHIPAPAKTVKKKRLKLQTSHVLVAMASIVFILGVSVALLGLKTNKEVGTQVQGAATSESGEGSQEDTPALGDHIVAPHEPRYLSIAKLGVKGRVMQVGVNAQGQLEAPYNVNDAGWYRESALPGDAGGAMLVDGHAYGPTQPGIFDRLEDLQAGDQIQVERGDGKMFTFKVVKTKTFNNDNVDMASAMVSADTNRLGLNLITCSGEYDPRTGDYDQRHIVYAVKL